jgi:hypothetical protein
MICGQWLLIEHVERRARDPSLPQRFDERRFVDDVTTRRVHQQSRRFH